MPTIDELRAREAKRLQRVYWFARGRRRHLAKFSPLDLSGLQIWLDASDSSTLFQDSAKTTTATADDDPVGAWADKSGNEKDCIQTTADNRPTHKASIQNGKSVIRLDGSNDHLLNDAFAETAQPNTVFIVAKSDDADTLERQMIASGNATKRHIISTRTGLWRFYGGTGINGGTDDSSFHIFVALFNGASSELRIDGVQVASGDAGSEAYQDVTVGANASRSGNFWDGDIAEILFYDSDQTANFARLESYLSSKWAVTLVALLYGAGLYGAGLYGG